MRADIAWIVRDLETGQPAPGVPPYRGYPSEDKARRAAVRAARTHGRAFAWGWDRPSLNMSMKYECGVIAAPVQS